MEMFYTRFLNSYMNWSLKKRDFARARSLFKRKDIGMKRYFMAFIGVVFIGFSVAVLNLSGFGVDPFSCMNMSVSAHLPFSFGVWQIFVNAVILMLLVIHVIKEKKKIGAVFGFGTLWNMTGVGLLVDFFTTKYHIFFQNPQNLGIRILFLVIAILGICLGCSIYMTPELGSAPYDALGVQIHEISKVPFKLCRITTDLICVIIAIIFGANIGIGTVITAFGTGPFVQFFNEHISKPWLHHKRRGRYAVRRTTEPIQ